MFRSEDMSLNQVMFAKESMWETMNHLANSEKVMFTHSQDLSAQPSNQLSVFSSKMVKRCEELTVNLAEIEEMMGEFEWPILPYTKTAKEYINSMDGYFKNQNIEIKNAQILRILNKWC